MANQAHQLIACPDCDLLQRIPSPVPAGKLYCPRCHCFLPTPNKQTTENSLPLVLAALIFFILANIFPLLTLSRLGIEKKVTMLSGIYGLWSQGYELAAVAVVFCAVLSPAIYIGCMLVVVFIARRPFVPAWIAYPLHWSRQQQKWAMLEVMMVAVLISLIQFSEYAAIIPGIASYALGVLIVLLTAIKITFSPEAIWDKMEWQFKSHMSAPATAREISSAEGEEEKIYHVSHVQ
jgi:paraquat-inducible protein A